MITQPTEQKQKTVKPECIPQYMKDRKQWVLWKYEARSGTVKLTKVPYHSRGEYRANSTDPNTWSDFATCVETYNLGGWSGIGFVFSKDDKLFGLDLDYCIDQTGDLKEWAKEIINQFAPTYTEWSPSVKGIHIYGFGYPKQLGQRKWNESNIEQGIELYSDSRFFTVTGDTLTAPYLGNCQNGLDWLQETYFQRSESPHVPTSLSEIEREELRRALSFIPSDDRKLWIDYGMAMKEAGMPFEIFDEWSRKSEKYDPNDCKRTWDSLKPRGEFTLNSIFWYAQQQGYSDKSASSNTMSTMSVKFQDKPQEIDAEMLLVPEMELDMIPPALQDWVKDASELMANPPRETIAVMFMIVLSSVVGAGCRIQPKQLDSSFVVVPNLWGGIVAPPGTKKSAIISKATKLLNPLISAAEHEFEMMNKEYSYNLELFNAKKKLLLQQLKSTTDKSTMDKSDTDVEKSLKALPQPNKPSLRRYKSNDTTTEKFVEMLSENHRGILYEKDELAGLLESFNRHGRESDRSFWLEAWNGDSPYSQDRVGRGTVRCKNLCVSILGSIQPDRLNSYLTKSMNTENDGFFQRFQLMLYPEFKPFVYVDREPDPEAELRVSSLVKKLSKDDLEGLGAEQTLKGPVFKFNPEGQQVYEEWITPFMHRVASETGIMKEHLSKYQSLMPSLSLLFHLIAVVSEMTPAGPVTKDSAELAIRWCNYLELHARRIYGSVTGKNNQSLCALAEKIKSKALPNPFTARELYRHEWKHLADANTVTAAAAILCDKNWLFKETTEKGFQNKGSTKYWIHPELSG